MPNFTLRQLNVFVTVARLGSITLAAKQLFMTQSAASMALAQLEQTLGKTLFERYNRNLTLSHIGQALLPKAVAILEQSEAFGHIDSTKELEGTLHIAASSTIGNYVLPAYFSLFSQKHPKVQLISQIENTQAIIHSLLQYKTDIGFIEGYCDNAGLIAHPWLTDELYLCVGPKHPLAKKTSISDKALAQAIWIMREPGSGTRVVFEHAIRQRINQLNILMELSSSEAIKAVVRQGTGICCLSQHVVQHDLEQGTLIRLHPDVTLQRQYSWLAPPFRMTSPLIEAWLALITHSIQ